MNQFQIFGYHLFSRVRHIRNMLGSGSLYGREKKEEWKEKEKYEV